MRGGSARLRLVGLSSSLLGWRGIFYLFGDPMLADQSEGLLLSFRVAYNAMPLSDWPIAALSWVPSYGNVIAGFIFGEAAPLRFGITEPGAYFTDGHAIFAHELAKTAAGENTFFKVWMGHVAADPIRHVLTSIPLFTRGVSADSPPGVVRYMHSVTPAPNATLGNTKVYVLISNRTISAGVHPGFALKRTQRATLIGEKTRGAGHVETELQLSVGYSAVIPFARAFDPRTGEGWEGGGVTPDIAVPARTGPSTRR